MFGRIARSAMQSNDFVGCHRRGSAMIALRFVDCAERRKIQARVVHLLLEKRIGNDCGAVASFLQCASEFNHRMHVARAADRRQQNVQIPSIFSYLGLSFIDLKL